MHKHGLWCPRQGQVVRKWVWAVPCQATSVLHGHVGQQVPKELNTRVLSPILRNCSRKRRGEARGKGGWSGQCPASPSSHLKAMGGLFPAPLSCSMLPVRQRMMANASCWSPHPGHSCILQALLWPRQGPRRSSFLASRYCSDFRGR